MAFVSALLVLMAALVLGVACMNLANLLLARGAARRKEIAVRQALGCGRWPIVRQLFVEGLTLSAIGAACGVVIAVWVTRLLSASLTRVLPFRVDVEAALDLRVLAAVAGFAVLATIAFALGPAWALARAPLTPDLKGDAGRRSRLASGPALVVAQIAVSLALVTAGGLFVRGAIKAVDDRSRLLARPSARSSGSTRASPATARRARARSTATRSSASGRCPASPARAFPRPCPSATSRKAGRCRSDPRPPSRRTSPWSAPTSSARSGCTCCAAASSRARKNRAAGARPPRPSSPSRWRASCSATPTPSAVRSRCREHESEALKTLEVVGVAPGMRHDLFDAAPVARAVRVVRRTVPREHEPARPHRRASGRRGGAALDDPTGAAARGPAAADHRAQHDGRTSATRACRRGACAPAPASSARSACSRCCWRRSASTA